MKKIFALLLAIIVVFSTAACGKKNGSGVDSGSSGLFQNTESYSVALAMTINPQFTLYLDSENKVISADYLNDDAIGLKDKASVDSLPLDEAVKKLVTAANDGGFIKEGAKITFQIIESKSGVDTESILSAAKKAASDTAALLKLKIEVEAAYKTEAVDTSVPSQNDSSKTPSSQTKSETSNPTQTTPVSSAAAHTHVFSKATCQKPATCSCGVTSGGKADHNYVGGQCSWCGVTSFKDIKTANLTDNYIGNYSVQGDMLIGYGINLGGDLSSGEIYVALITRMFEKQQSDPMQTPVTFNGQTFYSIGEGANPKTAELSKNGITVHSDEGDITFGLLQNGKLMVIESKSKKYPQNMLLSCNTADFLEI